MVCGIIRGMRNLKKSFITIFKEQRGLFILMGLNFLFGLFVLIFSLVTLNPDGAVVKIGYGDIGGYRDGTWVDMLTFPILSIIFGVLHNFLAVKIYEKHGDGIAKVFVVVSFLLLVGTFIVLTRLLGEG